uniref:Uncharacterized protein n=1 Tax=viral metagenome TaxID=1070528 RepID=A0A6H1ZK20_9ZZZZ
MAAKRFDWKRYMARGFLLGVAVMAFGSVALALEWIGESSWVTLALGVVGIYSGKRVMENRHGQSRQP